MKQEKEAFARLLQIMNDLREKCPWDRKQTMDSLRYLSIEEVYELSDAILENNTEEIKKEIGDLLLHMVFYAKIASENADFDITEVIHTLCDKLVDRHPHIYGNTNAENEEVVKQNWEKIKLKEGKKKSVLGGVPQSLPAMVKAMRIQEKAKGVGFDWDNKAQVWEKVEEELSELGQVINTKADQEEKNKIEEEFGDTLFSLVNYARFIGVNPEDALEKTNKKFIRRFNYLEEESRNDGKDLSEMSLEEMETYWQQAKENK